ncbi:hypothetical protein GOODEAATRI_017747, partial [Goodea atripinnis]
LIEGPRAYQQVMSPASFWRPLWLGESIVLGWKRACPHGHKSASTIFKGWASPCDLQPPQRQS